MNVFAALIAKLASPRTLLAVALSTGVTGVVAGPLTHEAFQARDAAEQQDTGSGDGSGRASEGVDGGGEAGEEPSTTTAPSTTVEDGAGAPGGGSPTTVVEPTGPGISGGPDAPTDPGILGGPEGTPPTAAPPTRVPPTSRPPRPPAVLVSVSPSLERATAMEGSQLSGTVYVFVDTGPDANVVFEVDGSPVEEAVGFGDPLVPLDTTTLAVGPHLLTVTVTLGGQTTTSSVPFTVAR